MEQKPDFEDKEEIKNFEETRRFLINQYNSGVLHHAGLLIAIIIGSLTLVSRWDIFFKETDFTLFGTGHVFILLLALIIGVSAYVIAKWEFWIDLSYVALAIPQQKVNPNFSRFNSELKKKLPDDSPCTIKLESAVIQELKDKKSILHRRHSFAIYILFFILGFSISSVLMFLAWWAL